MLFRSEEVTIALQTAVDNNQRVTVRGGGHCYEDFVSGNYDGVIIDLSLMHRVYEANGLYCVEGGCTLWNVYEQLYKQFGVTLPGGSCYAVGAGGHIIGGGYGFLSRRDGLIVDYLQAVEVVRVNEAGKVEVKYVAIDSEDEEERTMFWAHTGGGGGNFGIVTKYWFKDPPKAPVYAYLLNVAWDWSELLNDYEGFASIIRNYGAFFEVNSGIDSPYKNLFTTLALTHHSSGQIVLTAQFVSDDLLEFEGDHPPIVKHFLDAIHPPHLNLVRQKNIVGHYHKIDYDTTTQHLTWLEATQSLNGIGPNRRGKYKSAYMIKPFPEEQIQIAYDFLTSNPPNLDLSSTLLQVDSYGCQINALSSKDKAIPQRSSILKLQYQVYWKNEPYSQDYIDWMNDFYRSMYANEPNQTPYPNDIFDGCYVNYPDVDLEDWQYLYYKENYSRLQRAKRLWDPLGVFWHRQSIER